MTDAQVKTPGSRAIVRIFGLILLLPAIFLTFLALITPITITGMLYLTGALGVSIGLCGVAWGYRRFRPALWLGFVLIIVTVTVRLIMVNRDGRIRMLTLPEEQTACILNCIFDEQDAALFSTLVLPFIGWISPTEQTGLIDAMYSGYQAMTEDAGQAAIPSPVVRTYLGLQRPGAFDMVVIKPPDHQPVEMGLIFLHGFTGNFTMPCWLVAGAVRELHGLTVCPSVGWRGDWWTADGEATLRATIDYLHGRGVSRIVLAGLSNGAVGGSELAPRLTEDIAGLILISGASPNAGDSGLPVLVLAGQDDERMPADLLRAYADRMGTLATFQQFESDHFMLAKIAPEIQAAIGEWLRQN
ncbi:MAG: hypothetical protein K8I30_15305 [Anaerolineae bacterium]|nr:hypothetical protein [Anaerolineae bacterium]